jgi:hypothetical protein
MPYKYSMVLKRANRFLWQQSSPSVRPSVLGPTNFGWCVWFVRYVSLSSAMIDLIRNTVDNIVRIYNLELKFLNVVLVLFSEIHIDDVTIQGYIVTAILYRVRQTE